MPNNFIPILDTHLHLLYQDEFTYPWCAGVPALNRSFHIEDYQSLIKGHGVGGSIFMEVDVEESQSGSEAAFFSNLVNKSNNPLTSVIAACRPEHADFSEQFEILLNGNICGMRRILHNQPDGLSRESQFRENIQRLAEYGLPFDMCFLERQLPLAYDLAKDCPGTQFILDHCGNPTIKDTHFEGWKASIEKIATLPNVVCKLSGIVANCERAEDASLDRLRPWLETTVGVFGCDRIVWGSDWPVCNLMNNLPGWLQITREFVSRFTDDEQHAILHGNAESTYGVTLKP